MNAAQPRPRPSRTTRLRRRVIAISTAGSALALFASEALDPVGEGTPDNLLAAATTSQGAMVASALVLLLSSVLLVPAVVGIVHLVRHRGAATAHVGGALLVLGGFGHAMAATFYLIVSTMPGRGVDAGQVASLLERVDASPNLAVAFVFILSFALGLLLAFIGLRRARIVPTWVLGAIVAAFAIEFAAPGGYAVGLVKQALGLVAFGYLALREWRMSDADWALPPALSDVERARVGEHDAPAVPV